MSQVYGSWYFSSTLHGPCTFLELVVVFISVYGKSRLAYTCSYLYPSCTALRPCTAQDLNESMYDSWYGTETVQHRDICIGRTRRITYIFRCRCRACTFRISTWYFPIGIRILVRLHVFHRNNVRLLVHVWNGIGFCIRNFFGIRFLVGFFVFVRFFFGDVFKVGHFVRH